MVFWPIRMDLTYVFGPRMFTKKSRKEPKLNEKQHVSPKIVENESNTLSITLKSKFVLPIPWYITTGNDWLAATEAELKPIWAAPNTRQQRRTLYIVHTFGFWILLLVLLNVENYNWNVNSFGVVYFFLLNLSQSTCIREINVPRIIKHSFNKQLINFTMSTDRNKPIMTLIHAQCTQPLLHEHKCSCQWHFTFSVTHHK